MVFKLIAKECEVVESSQQHINRHLEKLSRFLKNIEADLPILHLIIRKNRDRYHPKKISSPKAKSYVSTKPSLAYYEGSIVLTLPKKLLYAHFKGQTVDECVNLGFERITQKVIKYKDTHFPTESEYPDRASIRQM